MRNNTFHHKAPRRTIAATVLALTTSLIALGASPAAASPGGAGRFGSTIYYDYPGPLDPPAPTSWTSELLGLAGPATLVVGGHTWVKPENANGGGDYNASSIGEETYLEGHGTVHSFSQDTDSLFGLGESASFALSGTYRRTGESMILSLTGDATVYRDDPYAIIAQGPISMEVTLFLIPLLNTNNWLNGNCGSAPGCVWHGPYTQTDGLVNEVPNNVNNPSNDCNLGQQISDNTTQGVHSKLYVQPYSDAADICVRVELVPSGEGYGGKLSITPTGLDPDVDDPLLPSQDTNSTACTSTTPNLVPGTHPITSGGLGGVTYMLDAYASSSEAWLCLQVDSQNLRVKVPLGNSVPNVTYGYAATWYPDPGTP